STTLPRTRLRRVSTRPPTRSRASTTVTRYPAYTNSSAQASPANPAPMTRTRLASPRPGGVGAAGKCSCRNSPPTATPTAFRTSRRDAEAGSARARRERKSETVMMRLQGCSNSDHVGRRTSELSRLAREAASNPSEAGGARPVCYSGGLGQSASRTTGRSPGLRAERLGNQLRDAPEPVGFQGEHIKADRPPKAVQDR